MDLQKQNIVCETCGRERACFIIPDGRIICPRCSPKAVYQRWEEEWKEFSKQLAKEEKRLRKEEERARRAAEKQIEKESRLQEAKAQQQDRPGQGRAVSERDEKWEELYGAMEDEQPELPGEVFAHWREMVLHLDSGWLRFTEMAMAVCCVLAFLSGVYYLFQSFRAVLSPALADSTGSGETVLALGAFILKALPIVIGIFSVWGLYQISRMLRLMIDGLEDISEAEA